MKLFEVNGHYQGTFFPFFCFVLAENEIEAKKMVEEEIHFEINIESVNEIDITYPKCLCSGYGSKFTGMKIMY